MSPGLAVTTFSPGLSVFTDGSGSLFAGSQDNGTERYARAGTYWAWTRLASGDGGYTAVDSANNNVLYHEFFKGNMERSQDGGNNWLEIVPPFNGQVASWVMPFMMDARDSSLMFAGANQTFRTTTGGLGSGGASGWSAIPAYSTFYKITALDEQGGNQLAVGDENGTLGYSFDAGTTWHTTHVFNGSITVVKFDPWVVGRIWVGGRDFQDPFTPHLIRVDGADGTTPTSIAWDSGIGAPIDSLLVTGASSWRGPTACLYVRNRFGGSWTHQISTPFGTPAIPATAIVDLRMRDLNAARTGPVVALTHGRGAWLSNDISFLSPHVSIWTRGPTSSVYTFVFGAITPMSTITAGRSPQSFGTNPNAIAYAPDGTLYVSALGSQPEFTSSTLEPAEMQHRIAQLKATSRAWFRQGRWWWTADFSISPTATRSRSSTRWRTEMSLHSTSSAAPTRRSTWCTAWRSQAENFTSQARRR